MQSSHIETPPLPRRGHELGTRWDDVTDARLARLVTQAVHPTALATEPETAAADVGRAMDGVHVLGGRERALLGVDRLQQVENLRPTRVRMVVLLAAARGDELGGELPRPFALAAARDKATLDIGRDYERHFRTFRPGMPSRRPSRTNLRISRWL